MGLIEPLIVLGLLYGIYEVTRRLDHKTKQRYLWRAVALILAIGALGAAYQLLTKGTITAPPGFEGMHHPAAM
jgi:hypothetical protein